MMPGMAIEAATAVTMRPGLDHALLEARIVGGDHLEGDWRVLDALRHAVGEGQVDQRLAVDLQRGEALERQEIGDPRPLGAEHVLRRRDAVAEQRSARSPISLADQARGIARADQRADAAAGDDRGLDAEFVEDFEHAEYGRGRARCRRRAPGRSRAAHAPAFRAKAQAVSARGWTCVTIAAASGWPRCRRARGRRYPAGSRRGGRNYRRDRYRDRGCRWRAGASAIARDIVVDGRNARDRFHGRSASRRPHRFRHRHEPLHQMIGEIGQRIAERRELPVEHRDDARLGRMDDAIVERGNRHGRCAAPFASGTASGSQAISRSIAAMVLGLRRAVLLRSSA